MSNNGDDPEDNKGKGKLPIEGGSDCEQWIQGQKCSTSAMAQGSPHMSKSKWLQKPAGGNTSAVARGEPPKYVDKGAGSGSNVLPVHEGMLNEQPEVVMPIPAHPASTFLGGSASQPVEFTRSLPPPPSAAQTVRQGRLARTRIPINVVMRGRWADKHQYKFHVDPNQPVTVLKELLAAESAHLPPDYNFGFHRTVMDEIKSFRDNGIVGVGVPEIEVVDCTAKLPTDQVY